MRWGMRRGIRQCMRRGIRQGMRRGIRQGMRRGIRRSMRRGMRRGIRRFSLWHKTMNSYLRAPITIVFFFYLPSYHIVNEQRTANPNLKTLLAVTFTQEDFTRLEGNQTTRGLLINNVVDYLRLYTFNGIEELSAAFYKNVSGTASEKLILAMSVSARKLVIDKAYDVKAISRTILLLHSLPHPHPYPYIRPRYVDMFNLETAKFRNGRESTIGHFSPLYGDYRVRTDPSSVDFAARYWQLLGAPKRKINIGVALSGVAYKIDKPYMHYIGSAARGPGEAGEFTNVAGTLSYFEVCQYLNAGASVYRSRDQEVPHLVHDHEWVGFEDSQSLQAKVRYVLENQFGGLAIWSIDLDDYSGEYCGTVSYPLLAAINQACENFTFT
ncbi:Chitinase-3-like protein 1 [Bulinus truncatus]|nr:Chitinase-3-like protein 1 [Bulinus truncatus]